MLLVLLLVDVVLCNDMVQLTGLFVEGFKDYTVTDIVWIDPDLEEVEDQRLEESILFYRRIKMDVHLNLVFQSLSTFQTIGNYSYDGDMTLYVIPKVTNDFLSRLKYLESVDLVNNVVLIFSNVATLETMKKEMLQLRLLRLDTQLYVVINRTVEEWYQISSDYPVKTIEIAQLATDAMVWTKGQLTWERRDNLEGLELTVGYATAKPFIFRENENLTGIVYEIAETLFSALNISVRYKRHTSYGTHLDNGTWLGLIGAVNRGEVDMAVQDMSITDLRSKVVDFGIGMFESSARIFVMRPEKAVSWTTFIFVFSPDFWTCLGIGVLLVAIGFHLSLKFAEKVNHRNYIESLCSTLMAVGGLSVPEAPVKLSSRILFLSFCIFGALVYWSYNAILVSLLAIDKYNIPIKSLEDLLTNGRFRPMVLRDTAYSAYFTDSSQTQNMVAFKVNEEFFKNNPKSLQESTAAAIEQMRLDESYVFFADRISMMYVDGYPCSIVTESQDYFKNYIGFPFTPGSPYIHLFNSKILLMRQSGQIEKIKNYYLDELTTASCDTQNFKEISYENIFTAFVVLACGIIFALILSFCENRLRHMSFNF